MRQRLKCAIGLAISALWALSMRGRFTKAPRRNFPIGGSAPALVAVSTPISGRSGLMRSEEHTSELQSLMRISYAVFCLKKKKNNTKHTYRHSNHIRTHPQETQYIVII